MKNGHVYPLRMPYRKNKNPNCIHGLWWLRGTGLQTPVHELYLQCNALLVRVCVFCLKLAF